MKRLPNKAFLGALCLLVAFLPGCKKKEEAPPPSPAPPSKPAAKPLPPVQQQVSSATAQGAAGPDFRTRRDPFKPFLSTEKAPPPAGGPAAAAGPRGDQLPIQSYEVTKFKVSGIIAGLKENRALLVDPQGKPYVVQVGMVIGNNNGRISRITASTVEVEERVRDDRGRVKKRTIVLTLAKKR